MIYRDSRVVSINNTGNNSSCTAFSQAVIHRWWWMCHRRFCKTGLRTRIIPLCPERCTRLTELAWHSTLLLRCVRAKGALLLRLLLLCSWVNIRVPFPPPLTHPPSLKSSSSSQSVIYILYMDHEIRPCTITDSSTMNERGMWTECIDQAHLQAPT